VDVAEADLGRVGLRLGCETFDAGAGIRERGDDLGIGAVTATVEYCVAFAVFGPGKRPSRFFQFPVGGSAGRVGDFAFGVVVDFGVGVMFCCGASLRGSGPDSDPGLASEKQSEVKLRPDTRAYGVSALPG